MRPSCILKDVKTYEIVYDLIQKEGEPVLNIPITFPEGEDWKALMSVAAQVQIKGLNVKVRPMQNMVVSSAEPTPGYVSGDFVTYLVAYPGCTYNDNEGMTISTAAITGAYTTGTRTTGMLANIPLSLWNTFTTSEDVPPQKVKLDPFDPIDVEALMNPTNFYQAGKLVIGIKPDEFKIANTTTTASAVKRQIADKIKLYGKEEKVEQTKKKSRRNSNPTIKTDEYPDEPIEIDGKKHLYVKWAFQVELSTKVEYLMKVPAK